MWWKEITEETAKTCQVLVIGTGPGGSFAAMTLAEAGMDVIVLEKGDPYGQGNIPRNLREATQKIYAEGSFRTADGSNPCPIAGGEGLGGGTLVNSAICFQTPTATLEDWNLRCDNIFGDTESFYQTQRDIFQLLQITETPEYLLSGNDKVHKTAAQTLGWKEANIWRNTPTCVGCSRCNAVCPSGGKNSMNIEILPRAVLAGAQIYIRCHVDHIEENATGCVVKVSVYGSNKEKIANLQIQSDLVIMAGGAIGTPEILLRSGMNNTQIGKGLHIHPVISTWGMLPNPCNSRGATQGHCIEEFSDDWVLLEANPIIMGAFFQSFPIFGTETHAIMQQADKFVSTGALVKDIGEGQVHMPTLPTNNAHTKKSVISYELHPEDKRRLIKGLRVAAELYLQGADATQVAPSIFGASWCKTMKDVETLLPWDMDTKRLIPYSSHPQSSCRIGRACTQDGKLIGSNNIYVFDSSALPTNVGRNPQISIMTLSRILSERLLAKNNRAIPALIPTPT